MTQDKPLNQQLAEKIKMEFVKLGFKFDVAGVDTFSREAAKVAVEFAHGLTLLSRETIDRTVQSVRNM